MQVRKILYNERKKKKKKAAMIQGAIRAMHSTFPSLVLVLFIKTTYRLLSRMVEEIVDGHISAPQ